MRKTKRYSMEQLSDAVAMLRKGGLVAVPTETVYGLAADAENSAAIWTLFEVKQREREKALSILVTGMEMVERYCEDIPSVAYALAEKYWPGPLTMILEDKGVVSALVNDEGDTLGDTDARRQHLWRGHADLLRGRDHDAPRNETRILAGLDHARQIVQRGIDVRAAHRLDEGTRHVVVLVAAPAHERLIRGCLHAGHRNLSGAVIAGHPRRGFKKRQGLTRVGASQAHEARHGLVGDGKPPGKTALVGQGAPDQALQRIGFQGAQRQQERAREQGRDHGERRVLRRRSHENDPPVLDRGKERILLRLGESVNLVDEKDRLLAAARQGPTRGVHDTTHVAHPR